MASIEERHSKASGAVSYRVIWRDKGQRNTQTFADRDAARQWKDVLERTGHDSAKAERAVLSAASPSPTVKDAGARHIASLTNLTPYTLQVYERQVRLHISPTLGHLPVDQVTRDDVAEWVMHMRDKGLSPKTITNVHGLMSSIFSTAVLRNWCAANPCSGARLPKVSKRDDKRQFLSHGEFALLLSKVDPHFRPFIMLLAGTGLRFSEATALTSADFQDAGGGEYLVTVSKAWKEDRAKGRYVGDPKSDAAHRVVQMDATTAHAVAPLVGAARASEPVFMMKRGGALTTQQFRRKVWLPAVEAAQAAGLRKSPRPHDLRHTFASWQLTAGAVSMDELAKIMGHESSKTTYSVYYHLMPDSRRQAASTMSGIMGRVQAAVGAATDAPALTA